MLGHVTSSYYSGTLGRPFALAMVKAGRERIGKTIYAALPDGQVTLGIRLRTDTQGTASRVTAAYLILYRR